MGNFGSLPFEQLRGTAILIDGNFQLLIIILLETQKLGYQFQIKANCQTDNMSTNIISNLY